MKVTANDIAQLLASAPPRQVPAHVRQAANAGRASWFLPLFGVVFGGMGLLFVAVFFPWRFLDDLRLSSAGALTTPGLITAATKTNMTINEVAVMSYRFQYTPLDGRVREGICYTTGENWSNSTRITVRYLSHDPDVGCVEGARLSEGGLMGAFVILFPLVGAGTITWFMRIRRQTNYLLQQGQLAEVDVVAVSDTKMKVNRRKVYAISLLMPSLHQGQRVTVKRANPADVALANSRIASKQPVFVLYDSRQPSRLLFPEALVGQ